MRRADIAAAGVVAGCVASAWGPAASADAGSVTLGDWQIAPVVDARLRGDVWHYLPGRDGGELVERARLGADLQRTEFEARVVLQEAGTLGAGADLTGGPVRFTSTGPYELWGDWRPCNECGLLRVGLQPIEWGEGRLLGTDDWSAAGRTLYAARARLALAAVAVEGLAAVLVSSNVPAAGPYAELFGARAELAFDSRLALEGYVLARVAQDNPLQSLDGTVRGTTYATALRVHGETRRLEWGVEGAYELGHVDELGRSRAAWATASHVATVFERLALRPTVRFGVAYASGDRGGSTYGGFDPLLPDEHRWHGAMDLFAWSNEAEVSAGLAMTPLQHVKVAAEYRYVRLAQAAGIWHAEDLTTIGGAPGNTHADLGHEADVGLTWSTAASLELSAGYSLLTLGEGGRAIIRANQLGSPDLSQFAYVQATLRVQ